ncbi:T9SS type A sorting domain-containing protein [Tamlana sp. 2201CG12-4]|uniref:T9SS type A sorting domain-containing protein n=1 Tax=Tamlana sp. 2201CG12-4 TaxID=3112582 RepID=UPI002DB9F1CA|nr:T9SS type A sorting domain-containing protein [Tamlana sp. 2201CG12-4]MEC3907870.1 T9SS type A sorting domain-containing protein [Tamlana sp. 2201CG12-4]
MYYKITRLKCLETLTKKMVLIMGGLLITGSIAFGQDTVIDFETPSEYQHLAWEGIAEVVTNPNSGGINTSSNVAKYTVPAGKSWGNASVVIINNALNYKDLDNIQFSVIAPSATLMYAKLELDGVGGVAEAYVTPGSDSGWQLVTLNFTALGGVDVNTATYDKFTFFFNVNDNTGGEAWHFDNISVQNKVLSVEDVSYEAGQFYPNPVRDVLFFKGQDRFKDSVEMSIYSITGQLLKSSKSTSVDVSDISKGVYLAAIENKLGQKTIRKFIKE